MIGIKTEGLEERYGWPRRCERGLRIAVLGTEDLVGTIFSP